jgi:hypothetical protein
MTGTGGADEFEDRVDDRFRHRHLADQCLDGHQPLHGDGRPGNGFLRTGGVEQDPAFGGHFRIGDVDLHQEAVELGFGQGIGAFLLERVLGCQDVEGARQVMRAPATVT